MSWRYKSITGYLLCWNTGINKYRLLPGQTITGPWLQQFVVEFKLKVNEQPKWKCHNISFRNAVARFDLYSYDWIRGWLPVRCFCWGGGAELHLWWAKPLPCVVAEDGWPRTTRSGRNVPTVPSGDSEDMIHFQHHFTQDDLITLCEWTALAMWTRHVRWTSILRGVSYEPLHTPPLFGYWIWKLIER